MMLIWKNLLHANFRCGRMYSARAEKQTLSHSLSLIHISPMLTKTMWAVWLLRWPISRPTTFTAP